MIAQSRPMPTVLVKKRLHRGRKCKREWCGKVSRWRCTYRWYGPAITSYFCDEHASWLRQEDES
jgi:hypothetical protein